MSADDSHHHDEPGSYAKAVKDGDGYENHDYQPSDVPGVKTHDPAHRPTTFAGAVKHGQLDGVPGMLTPQSHAEHSREHKRAPTQSEVSLDMASGTPITLERRAGQSAVHGGFPHPSIPRARFAADPAHGPQADAKAKATWEHHVSDAHDRRAWERRAALEKHCAFFDRDNDGVIWPHDTFFGFYALGFGLIMSFISMIVIHSGFSWLSGDGWMPDPLFRFRIHNAYKCKHGSDSGTYDTEGRFISQKFDDMFAKYSSDPAHGYLTIPDTLRMLKGNRIIVDPFGWFAAAFEWGSLWYMVSPKDRRLKRDDVRAAFTGDLFYRIAHQRKQGKSSKHGHGHHMHANGANGSSHSY